MKLSNIVCILLLTLCSNINASESHINDYSVLLSSLLNLNEKKYTYIDDKGKNQPDFLKEFKMLESIYIDNIKPDLSNNKFSNNRLKIVLFYSFYSYEHKSAAFLEYLASDLMPIYIDNKDAFLEILKELPFLIQSNCDRLNAYFGFEGKHLDNRSNFINQNSALFKKYLNAEQYSSCISSFN